MQAFDTFTKPDREFQVKTAVGGYLSLCSLVSITVLFLMELLYFMEVETRDEMFIDRSISNPVINITAQIDFHRMPCSTLDVNALDSKMTNLFGGGHHIYKTRLDENGRPIEGAPAIRDGFREISDSGVVFWTAMNGGHWARAQTGGMRLRCGPCYTEKFEANLIEDQCCESCSDVKRRGIPVSDRNEWVPAQCLQETNHYGKFPPQENEGCRFEFSSSLAKMTGTSQLIFTLKEKLDSSVFPPGLKSEFSRHFANFSHTINSLEFGDTYPGLVDVLNGRSKIQLHEEGVARFQYDLHLIPTRYRYLSGTDTSSHQYSVTEFAKKTTYSNDVPDNALTGGMYMNWDITPFTVKVTEWKKSWTHFLTECCAILGGIFAFSGMLDTFAYRITRGFGRRFASESFDTPGAALYAD